MLGALETNVFLIFLSCSFEALRSVKKVDIAQRETCTCPFSMWVKKLTHAMLFAQRKNCILAVVMLGSAST